MRPAWAELGKGPCLPSHGLLSGKLRQVVLLTCVLAGFTPLTGCREGLLWLLSYQHCEDWLCLYSVLTEVAFP